MTLSDIDNESEYHSTDNNNNEYEDSVSDVSIHIQNYDEY